jgi:phospholipase C
MHCYFGGGDSYHQFAKFQTPGEVPIALYNAVNLDRTTLFGNGTPGGIGDPANPTLAAIPNLAFEEDCANGVLADVSFIGSLASEHPPPGTAGPAPGRPRTTPRSLIRRRIRPG